MMQRFGSGVVLPAGDEDVLYALVRLRDSQAVGLKFDDLMHFLVGLHFVVDKMPEGDKDYVPYQDLLKKVRSLL